MALLPYGATEGPKDAVSRFGPLFGLGPMPKIIWQVV